MLQIKKVGCLHRVMNGKNIMFQSMNKSLCEKWRAEYIQGNIQKNKTQNNMYETVYKSFGIDGN